MCSVAHPSYLREKARALRAERRLTIDELAERLALPRTTVYHWVRDMPIPGSGPGGGWPADAQRKGTRAMQRKYKLLREAAYREGTEQYTSLIAEPTFRDFVCMYIGEGYKRSRNRVAICNSDPAVVVLGAHWVRRLSDRRAIFTVQHHADQQLPELLAFWGETLGVDADSIRAIRKSNSNQLTGRAWRSRHGVLTVAVDDTYLRCRLEAWIVLLKEEWRDAGAKLGCAGRGAVW
jgi:excisionase family DNA binding protein